MEVLIGFMLFGALIGYVAAKSRRYDVAIGLIGGALLGILSPIMFAFGSGKRKGTP